MENHSLINHLSSIDLAKSEQTTTIYHSTPNQSLLNSLPFLFFQYISLPTSTNNLKNLTNAPP